MLNNILKKTFIPIIIKIIVLMFLVLLIIIGFSAYSNDSNILNELRNTNWANLIVWSYWWPVIIVLSIFFGRVWCFICPIETITSFFSKIGLKRKVPAFLKKGWGITIFYIIILFLGIHGLAIHRNPTLMAIYLLFLIGASIIIGFVFEKNAFCSYFCPVGHLLGLYSRLSPFGWRVKNKSICKNCNDKACVDKNNLYNTINKSCGVGLYPAKITNNAECILCTGCMKACSKYNPKKQQGRPNPGFYYTGFSNIINRNNWNINLAIAFFILIVSGFVIYEILSEYEETDNILMAVPNYIKTTFSISNPLLFGVIKSVILFLLIPFIIVIIPYLFSFLRAKKRLSLVEYLVNYLPVIVPIMATAHLGKAILKTTSRIPYFKIIGDDTSGLLTANKLVNGTLYLNKLPEWTNLLTTILLFLFLTGGTFLSFTILRIKNDSIFNGKSPMSLWLLPIIYMSIFIITFIFWRIL